MPNKINNRLFDVAMGFAYECEVSKSNECINYLRDNLISFQMFHSICNIALWSRQGFLHII